MKSEADISNKDIFQLLQSVLQKTDNIETQIQTNKKELKQEIRNNNAEIKKELAILKQGNDELKKENEYLRDRLLKTERKLKKYNLIIYGLTEEENRSDEITSLLNLFNEKLNIDCQFADIRDYYRIGKKTEEKNRPAAVEFVNYQLKVDILANSRQLKGTGIFLSNDYILEDYAQRKILYKNLKVARKNNCVAFIKSNALIVNGETYTSEELENNPIITEEEQTEKEITETKNTEQDQVFQTYKNTGDLSTNDKIFEYSANPTSTTRKRKDQLSESENSVKRSTRQKNK